MHFFLHIMYTNQHQLPIKFLYINLEKTHPTLVNF